MLTFLYALCMPLEFSGVLLGGGWVVVVVDKPDWPKGAVFTSLKKGRGAAGHTEITPPPSRSFDPIRRHLVRISDPVKSR